MLKNRLRMEWVILATIILSCNSRPTIVHNEDINAYLKNLPTFVEKQMQDWHVPGVAVELLKMEKLSLHRALATGTEKQNSLYQQKLCFL